MMALHRVVVPKLSGVHRFACLALYRGLLRQCAKLPIYRHKLKDCEFLVKQRFRRYKSLQSPSQTVSALKAGYEAFDLLHSAAQKNRKDIYRILGILQKAQGIKQQKVSAQRGIAKATPTKIPPKRNLKKEEMQRQQALTARRHPDATPILARPRPVVSGKRHIPRFVSARGIPFLRIKKPQPQNLSGVIRSKLANRWGWIERRARLHQEIFFAEKEDYWDELTGDQDDGEWVTEIEDALVAVNNRIRDADTKRRELAEKMWQVVLAEREMVAKEEQERQEQQEQQEQKHQKHQKDQKDQKENTTEP